MPYATLNLTATAVKLMLTGIALATVACNNSGSAPPAAPVSATNSQDAGTSGSGSGSGSGSSSLSSSIFNSSGDTPEQVRSAQLTQINQEISRYQNQLYNAEATRDNLQGSTLPGVQQLAIPLASTPTLAGGAVTGIGDLVTGGVLLGAGAGGSGGSPSSSSSSSSSSSAAGGGGGGGGAPSGGSAFTSGFSALGGAVSASQQTKTITSDVGQISQSVQGSVDQINAEITDLQNTIASLQKQADALVAQGT